MTALLVASNEADLPSDKDIVKGLSSRLAKYKSPRRYAWVKEIPTLPSGKPNRNSKVLEGLTLNVLHYTNKMRPLFCSGPSIYFLEFSLPFWLNLIG